MDFPLTLTFKKLALSPQISVYDANDQLLFYVKQKLFKLREAIAVFGDKAKTEQLYEINADRIIDFSARYHFKDENGIEIGSIKRDGPRSLWKARYDIYDANEQPIMRIHEENGWVKVMDGLFGEIPIIGMLSGYVFNPTYLVDRQDGTAVMRVVKQPAFLESSFTIEKQADLAEKTQLQTVLGILMMTLLERTRG